MGCGTSSIALVLGMQRTGSEPKPSLRSNSPRPCEGNDTEGNKLFGSCERPKKRYLQPKAAGRAAANLRLMDKSGNDSSAPVGLPELYASGSHRLKIFGSDPLRGGVHSSSSAGA